MKRCPLCGKLVPNNINYCPIDGIRLSTKNNFVWVILLIVIIGLVKIVISEGSSVNTPTIPPLYITSTLEVIDNSTSLPMNTVIPLTDILEMQLTAELIPTQTQEPQNTTNSMTPDQFARSYWTAVNNHQCDTSWSWLSTDFQKKNPDYFSWCKKWDEVKINFVQQIEIINDQAKVETSVIFVKNGNEYSYDMIITIISDSNGGWLVNDSKLKR
jgi:RNA polymerase subunit RPABC4/transcription elongation factor Spt4